MVMHELQKLDKVAYRAFASVYRRFTDIDEFKTLVDGCGGELNNRPTAQANRPNILKVDCY